ncbi:MAG: hypothetical protein MUP41_13135 [Desulfobacterales bacterium]|nr:hypothetical protein [Desulfobacterales bacterium]
MMKIRTSLILFLGVFPLLFVLYPHTGHGLTLITPEEAAQPDAPVPRGVKLRTIQENGPQIKIFSPNPAEPIRVPFILDIAFEASSDKTVDLDSLSIKYLKLIAIDLTGRMKPYLNGNRLVVKEVKVPQGKHRLQFSIAYASGEKTMMEIVLNVEK